MGGLPILELNAGLAKLREGLTQDAEAAEKVELAVVAFGPVRVEVEFTKAADFQPPLLIAEGVTPIGEAIRLGIAMAMRRSGELRAAGVDCFRPWIVLVTDGAPTDDWMDAAQLVHEGEGFGSFTFVAVAVDDAALNVLRQISVSRPYRLQGLRYGEMLSWLADSLKDVVRSSTDDFIIPAPAGWAETREQ